MLTGLTFAGVRYTDISKQETYPVRVAAVFLMFLLVFQMQGTWLVFKAQQLSVRHEIKRQIKHGVPENQRVVIAVPKTWEKNNNERFQRIHEGEFRLNGEMYDILETKEDGDTLYYECIHDVKESGLFARLDELTESSQTNDPHKKAVRDKLASLLSGKFIAGNETVWFSHRPETGILSDCSFKVLKTHPDPLDHPPEGS